jgi:16S rRNA (guanine966-N2)-methyltransferase
VGAIGIEALSRGASHALFVERDAAAASAIRENLGRCGCEEQARVLVQDAQRALKSVEAEGERFAVAYADPPYDYPPLERFLRAFASSSLLEGDGLFVLERSTRLSAPEVQGLDLEREERYGDATLSFLTLSAESA